MSGCPGAVALVLVALAVAPIAVSSQQATARKPEASGSFEMEDVEPFLMRVATLVDSGLTAADVRALADQVAKQPVGSKREYQYTVKLKGVRQPLRISVVMTEDEGPDVTFVADSGLVRQIDAAMGQYYEDVEQ